MITDETLRAVVSYTTPGGTQLSKANNTDLIIRDTSHGPQTYDIYVDQNRGGYSIFRDGYHQKIPRSLYDLFREQYPNAVQKDGDIYNLRIARNTAIVGSTRPNTTFFSEEEINNAGIDLSLDTLFTPLMKSYQSTAVAVDHDSIYGMSWQHSDGDHRNRQFDKRLDFKGCYGKMRLFIWALHASTKTVSLSIYNADHTLASDVVYLEGSRVTTTVDIDIKKGQYGFIYVSYIKGNIDSKNNTFFMIKLSALSGGITPALLISKKFNMTHTINIFNDGIIVGYGGDGVNSTPQKGSSEWWNKDNPPVYTDTHSRILVGGDAILCTDVKAINIYNNGIIAGGGGSSSYIIRRSGPSNFYTPADGGAPYGRGGVMWSEYNARTRDGYIDPILHGKAGGWMQPGSANAGAWGKKGKDLVDNIFNYPPGFFYRGRTSQVNYYGSGQYLGLQPNSTEIP